METKGYFEKVMQDYNQYRNGRSLHIGSHFSAEDIVFMYLLLESCKLNNVNFGEYVEDILIHLMKSEKADASFLPNNYVPRPKEEANEAA